MTADTDGSPGAIGEAGWASDDTAPPDREAWDLLVVGGGTAGLVAAKTAAGFGASVLLVERDRIGGDCLWTGCVPSKALLSSAHAAADARTAGALGVTADAVTVDFAAVMRHVHEAMTTIEPTDSPQAMREAGVKVVHAEARFTGPDTAVVGGTTLRFRHALVATGAEPVMPPIPGLADAGPHTNETIFSLRDLPPRLLVLGGGSIGCELGQAFARLGSAVTLVEGQARLMQAEDADAAALVAAALTADGVDVRTASTLLRVSRQSSGWAAELADGTEIGFDVILVAVGRRPRTAAVALERAGIELDEHGFVQVDSRLRTTNPRVWAAGDVTRYPQFTHTAGVHGSLVAGNAVLGLRRTAEDATTPRVTFTQPEVAAFGVSLEQAQRRHLTCRTVPNTEVDRAITERRTAGFTRVVLDRKGRVVGATIVGPRAGESLAELVLAARHGLRARDIAASTHAYPTYGDGVWKVGIEQVQSGLRRPALRRVIGLLGSARRWWVSR